MLLRPSLVRVLRPMGVRSFSSSVRVITSTLDPIDLKMERRQRQKDGAKARTAALKKRLKAKASPAPLPDPIMGNVVHLEQTKLEAPVKSLQGGEVLETTALNTQVWDAELRTDLVHRMVLWERAMWRSGTATIKHRGQVAGSTRKVRPQKGSGRARVGDRRTPHWRGGGHAFGKMQKDWSHKLPLQVRLKALKSVLTAKFKEGNLHIIDEPTIGTHHTAELRETLAKNNSSRGLLIHASHELDNYLEFTLAARNIKELDLVHADVVGCYKIVLSHQLFITKAGLAELEHRLTRPRHHISFAVDNPPTLTMAPADI